MIIFLTFIYLVISVSTELVAEPSLESNRIYRSAYFLGRGHTGISNADHEDAIFYNPAGLAQGKGIYKRTVVASPLVEVSQATKDLARRLGAEQSDTVETIRDNVGKTNHISTSNFTGVILRRAALGAVVSGNMNLLAFKSKDSGGLEVIKADVDQNNALTFSVAEGYWGNSLMIGATGKYLIRSRGELEMSVAESDTAQQQLEDTNNFLGTGTGTGIDLGIMYHGNSRAQPAIGLTVNDVGDTSVIPSQETSVDLDLKQTVNLGMSITPGTKFSKFRVLLDYHDILSKREDNWRKKIHFGSEITVQEWIGVTGGLNQGYSTFGFYFDLFFFRLDAGMYTQEMGERVGTRGDSRYFFRMRAGF